MKPKHQMSQSKLMNDTTVDFEDLSKTRPFSLEERNLNINDISFSRILRTENTQSGLNTTRSNLKPQPPSFYEKDIKKWQDKFKQAIKNREKLKKLVAGDSGNDTQR